VHCTKRALAQKATDVVEVRQESGLSWRRIREEVVWLTRSHLQSSKGRREEERKKKKGFNSI
jgi:hypothetical protein